MNSSHSIKVYYHDTDCGGVVYYANYLKFLEEARTEFLSDKGISVIKPCPAKGTVCGSPTDAGSEPGRSIGDAGLNKELAKAGILFTVSRQEIDYKLPAFYGDVLEIDSRISKVSGVRLEFEHEIKNQEGRIICQAKTIMACVGADFKPTPISEEIRKKIAP